MSRSRAVAVTRSRTRATAGGRRGMSLRRDAGEPGVGVVDLGETREVLLALPDAVEPAHPGALHHVRDEPVAGGVLADLAVEPDQPLEASLHARGTTSLLEPALHPIGVANVLASDLFHHEVPVAFEQRHQALHPLEDLALLRRHQ